MTISTEQMVARYRELAEQAWTLAGLTSPIPHFRVDFTSTMEAFAETQTVEPRQEFIAELLGIDMTPRITFNVMWAPYIEEDEFEDTILHELAHAIVGSHQQHNEIWADMAAFLGVPNPTPYGSARRSAEFWDALMDNLLAALDRQVGKEAANEFLKELDISR